MPKFKECKHIVKLILVSIKIGMDKERQDVFIFLKEFT